MDNKVVTNFTVNDAKKRSKLEPSRAIEREFLKALRTISRESSKIVLKHVDGAKLKDVRGMKKALNAYSRKLQPWSRTQATKLVNSTIKRLSSDTAYNKLSRKIGKELAKVLFETEVGNIAYALIDEQVELIKSIPIEAGQRAQRLAFEAVASGDRASEIAKELLRTGEVTESRAKLIARTETARAATAINLARATSVGSVEFIWRTSEDDAVRPSHRKMNGKKFKWSDIPQLDDGTSGLPGTFPNCRCYAEPVLPDN